MNNQLEAPLTPREYELMREKLLALLARQCARYTMGESTSIPVELAQRLLDSICYCLGISPKCPAGRLKSLLNCDLTEAYQRGLSRIEKKKQFGKQLWQAVCAGLPPIENTSMLDTLKSIGTFWKNYDSVFFAHEIPCDIDYQLALPVPEAFQGIDYVDQYLHNLYCENRFLGEYSAGDMVSILHRYCPDHKGLLVNLFEPVAANALGLAILGRPDRPLRIDQNELGRLYDLFEPMGRAEIRRCLLGGVEQLKASHGPGICAYIARYCQQLAVRIDLLRDCGGLSGIFMTA